MFLRRKPNKSGTVSVQVIEKQNGKYVVLQGFDTRHNEEDIRRLELKGDSGCRNAAVRSCLSYWKLRQEKKKFLYATKKFYKQIS